MSKITGTLAASAAALLLTAASPTGKQEFLLQGFGAETCAEFAQQYRIDPASIETAFFMWAQGYMSGLNVAQAYAGGAYHNLNAVDNKTQMTRIRGYCDQHPLLHYFRAVDDVYGSLPTLPTPKMQ